MNRLIYKLKVTAQLLAVPLLVLGCAEVKPDAAISDEENTPTQISTNHNMVHSGNGVKRFRMFAECIMRYELAEKPKTVYPKGVLVQTFADSIVSVIQSDVRADSAVYFEKEGLWEAHGNVVANNYEGKKRLETELLYYNEKTGKIYTDKMALVIDGKDRFRGKGFETDAAFEQWSFYKAVGRMSMQMDTTKNRTNDSLPKPNDSTKMEETNNG